MLSISGSKSGSAAGDYYTAMARDDYYTQGGEPPGEWVGGGAKALGLTGQVKAEDFQTLANGFSRSGERLVQNAGKDDRAAFWDLTFSAPKSVSVLWSQAPEELKKTIESCHEEAVKKTLSYLEKEAGLTRRGKGGGTIEHAKLIFATFQHGTSRAQDPQLHTHAVLLNVGVREDGSTGSLATRGIFQEKMTAGALYRAELSALLIERAGLEQEKEKSWFEVSGVSKDLQSLYSKRREEITTLSEELREWRYKPHPVKRVEIPKAGKTNEQTIERTKQVTSRLIKSVKRVWGYEREDLQANIAGRKADVADRAFSRQALRMDPEIERSVQRIEKLAQERIREKGRERTVQKYKEKDYGLEM